jgi:hypothetical protein
MVPEGNLAGGSLERVSAKCWLDRLPEINRRRKQPLNLLRFKGLVW